MPKKGTFREQNILRQTIYCNLPKCFGTFFSLLWQIEYCIVGVNYVPIISGLISFAIITLITKGTFYSVHMDVTPMLAPPPAPC